MMKRITTWISTLNQKRKERYPSKFTSRKKFNHLENKYLKLVGAIASAQPPLSRAAVIHCVVPFLQKQHGQEICLFVTYSKTPQIKPHVAHHIKNLIASGIDVVLIINTDDISDPSLKLNELEDDLSGVYIRENIGFDFSAWSHVYGLICDKMNCNRLYLTNDSIVGPLSHELLVGMLTSIRQSKASLVGLTKNMKPRYHLQSFFLAINKDLLCSEFFKNYFKNFISLPTKTHVIDVYETNLTQVIEEQGYQTEALFALQPGNYSVSHDVYSNIDGYVGIGFPYIKTSSVNSSAAQRVLTKCLPSLVEHIVR